jgi:uncharacterized protein (DUF302 family)
MATRQIEVERFSVISSRPSESVMAAIEAAIGHPDIDNFTKGLASAKSFAEMAAFIQSALGSSGFMEFARYDLGAILRRELGPAAPRVVRLVIGNPLVMKEMVRHVPDAGSYAPVTILIDERPDGVHLSYDRMMSFLAAYGNAEALKVAHDLDTKVEELLAKAL